MDSPGAFHDFRSASAAVLEYLHRRIGFDLWLVTRVAGEEWIILQVDDHSSYGVEPGAVFRWADTFCVEMVKGGGPHIAPRTDCVKVYAGAPIGQAVKIGAYLGYPLLREDGTVFGTLCAVHPAPQPPQVVLEQPLLELMARLLSTILNAELKTVEGQREQERLVAQRFVEPVTDLYDIEGWRMLLAAEEERCKAYGNPACVIVIDLAPQVEATRQQGGGSGRGAGGEDAVRPGGHASADAGGEQATAAAPAGDPGEDAVADLLRIAAGCVTAVTRENDIVARIARDKIAVLAMECDRSGSRALLARLNQSLAGERIAASIGIAHRAPPLLTLNHAWSAAEQAAQERA